MTIKSFKPTQVRVAESQFCQRIHAIAQKVVSKDSDRYSFALAVVLNLLEKDSDISDSAAVKILTKRLQDED